MESKTLRREKTFGTTTRIHHIPNSAWRTGLDRIVPSVADPGCLSRIRLFRSRIPDPNFFHPGSRIRIKEFKFFNPKNGFQAKGNMIRVVHPGSGSATLIVPYWATTSLDHNYSTSIWYGTVWYRYLIWKDMANKPETIIPYGKFWW